MTDPAIHRSLARIEALALKSVEERYERAFCAAKERNGVTIFIPNWNQRPFLPRAIRSAVRAIDELESRGTRGEVVIVDDASRDGSQRLIRSLEMSRADERLLSVFLEDNIGLPRVRNLGLQLARYRQILFLDGDNELVPENLSLFVDAMRTTGAALAYGNLLERADEVVGVRSNAAATMGLFAENYIDAFALFDADQVMRVGGFDCHPQLYGWEDWELVLHLIEESRTLLFVPAIMGYYTINRRSMLRETDMRAAERYELIQRMHAPVGDRAWDPVRVGRIYHPAIGFLDEDQQAP
jgi:glycosyltransferase involved in cell wall biosynthesis